TAVPTTGWASVTVPGQVRAWADLHERLGRLPWHRLIEPSIDLAAQGCPVPPVVAHYWQRGIAAADRLTGPESAAFRSPFAPQGRAPQTGERVGLLGHARTLQRVGEHGADNFYTGEIATAIAGFAEQTG